MLRLFGPRRGSRYDGLVTYTTDYQLVDRPGFYALSDDGKRLRKPLLRLTCIDDAPGNEDDGAHHFIVAGKHDPVARNGDVVEIEAHGDGSAEVATS